MQKYAIAGQDGTDSAGDPRWISRGVFESDGDDAAVLEQAKSIIAERAILGPVQVIAYRKIEPILIGHNVVHVSEFVPPGE